MGNNSQLGFFMNMLRSGVNPEQMVMKLLQNQNNPFCQNLLSLIQKGDNSGLEQIARNMCQQKGLDFDKEFNTFKQQLGIK